jgi:hypothetical protein
MRPGVPPSCQCGECRLCKLRVVRRRFYARHKEQVIRENAAAKRARRANASPEVSDAELDRRALILMGRPQDAR